MSEREGGKEGGREGGREGGGREGGRGEGGREGGREGGGREGGREGGRKGGKEVEGIYGEMGRKRKNRVMEGEKETEKEGGEKDSPFRMFRDGSDALESPYLPHPHSSVVRDRGKQVTIRRETATSYTALMQ